MKIPRAMQLTIALAAAALSPLPAVWGADNEDRAVVAVLTDEAAAFREGDYDRVAAHWEQEETSSVIESGVANWGWADYRDNHLKFELRKMKVGRFVRSDFRVQASPDMAVATFRYEIAATFDGVPFQGEGLGTAVLRKRDGHWRIIHTHTSSARHKP